MGHSLEFKKLVDSLLHRSITLETAESQAQGTTLDALEELSDLSALTQKSFASAPAAPAASAASGNPSPATEGLFMPKPPRSEVVSHSVKLPEKYQDSPALKDQSVLNALLDYHSLHQPARGVKASRAPQAASPSKTPSDSASDAPALSVSRSRGSSALSQFRPAEIPVVDGLQRKEPPKKSIRSSQPTASVLRAKTQKTE